MKPPRIMSYVGPDKREGVTLTFPYSEILIEQLKEIVPSRDRRWWRDSKCWWVSDEHRETIEKLVFSHFDGIEFVDPITGAIEYRSRSGQGVVQEGLFA